MKPFIKFENGLCITGNKKIVVDINKSKSLEIVSDKGFKLAANEQIPLKIVS